MHESDKIRLFGEVKWWSLQRGYGYITCGPKDYWAHYSQVNSDKKFKRLKDGQKVSFCPDHNEKGDFATDISIIED